MPSRLQSAVDAAGAQAARIEGLWWLMFWVCTAVYVAVLLALGLALLRGYRRTSAPPSETTLLHSVSSATGVTVLILVGLVFASVITGRAIGFNRELPTSAEAPDAVVIEIVGRQWWWSVDYDNPNPSLRVTTANEMHIPVGRRIVITLKSADVIHSFWVPNLHGKMDLIPGRRNVITLQADKPGVYRGQCAEYCGLQHAHMAFTVVAEPSDDFERWLQAQRAPAPPPATPEQQRGLQVVEQGPCAMCHRVQGTRAGARFGPDLTHVATRSTIAAGTVPNTRENMATWITDPQHLKPGARMPAMGLPAEDVKAVLAYLETLR